MVESLRRYIYQILGQEFQFVIWSGKSILPLYLLDKYKFWICKPGNLAGGEFLTAKVKAGFDPTPAEIRKNFEELTNKVQKPCVLISDKIVSYDRKRLIEQKVSFIVIENQMYLPFLAMDLREFFKSGGENKKRIVPSVQAMILNVLHKQKKGGQTSEFINDLKYTKMTVNRAFDVIESMGWGEVRKEGRERYVEFKLYGKDLWEEVKESLKSRIKKRVIIDKVDEGGYLVHV